jgi:23S rRNA maturation-related 3'-5' exoribonuclease YhaM
MEKLEKKELYNLSVSLAQEVLRDYFKSPTSFKKEYFTKYPAAVKKIYDLLAPLLLK